MAKLPKGAYACQGKKKYCIKRVGTGTGRPVDAIVWHIKVSNKKPLIVCGPCCNAIKDAAIKKGYKHQIWHD